MKANKIIQAADLFCGAGGTSSGLYHACNYLGFGIDLVAVNHWAIAIETHKTNHPDSRHICATLENVNPREAVPSGKLDILVASPECTHHSVARGGKPVNDQLRASAWHVLRWIELLNIKNILIENVREFRDWGPTGANGKPLKRRKGETYQAFLTALRSMNYTVEDQIVNAADFGDPTSRHRLFIMAKRGQKKIVWPKATHAENSDQNLFGDELRPYRTAREIIDWDLHGESIFKRKKPLAKATMARIAVGLRKYGGRGAEPFLVMMYGTNDARSVDRPMPTITAGGNHIGVCRPFLIPQQSKGAPRDVDVPVPTICTKGAIALVEPFLVRYHGNHPGKNDGEKRTHSVEQPLPTLDTSNRYALVEPFIIPIDNSSNGTSGARSIDVPLGTIITQQRFGLCEPFIAILKGQSKTRDIDSPVPTITTNSHLYLCEPFITKYYGAGQGVKSINEPLDTVTTKDRFALVEPCMDGEVVYDIRFRMLQPHELAAAMSFDRDYQFTGNKGDKIKQIGNAVPVRTATALCKELLSS